MAYCIVSSVGLEDCAARALIGHRRALLAERPKNRNLPHSCCMNFLRFESSGGAKILSVYIFVWRCIRFLLVSMVHFVHIFVHVGRVLMPS